MQGQSAEGRLFVLPHEAAIAEDIGAEYGGELTFQYPPIVARLLLQPGLVQVGTDAFFICFILIRESLNEGVYREVGVAGEVPLEYRNRFLIPPHLGIGPAFEI